MKSLIWKLMLVLGLTHLVSATAFAAVINFTGGDGSFSASSTGSHLIPDAPSSGYAQALNFSFSTYTKITDISITFTTTGGWNGDLYAYLSCSSGGFAVLLNRVGGDSGNADGYSTSGFSSITLGLSGSDIHLTELPTSGGGPYTADGRMDYTSDTRANTLSVFNNTNPNGSWALYFGDQSATSESTLTGWSLNITAEVPEPVNVALGIFAGIGFAVGACRSRFWATRFGQK